MAIHPDVITEALSTELRVDATASNRLHFELLQYQR